MVAKKSKGAINKDEGKSRLDLVPHEVVFALGDILTQGLGKYDENQWEKGMPWRKHFASLQRHLWKWQSGEDLDPESGKSHLHHALARVAFLITYQARGVGEDNRPRRLPVPTKKGKKR
jgi:hypothetical protein